MVYRLLFLCVIFTANTGMAQVLRQVYHDDEKTKLKEMYFVRDTISNVLDGKYLSYYINGHIESEGQFENNETYGEWKFYYETGKPKMTGMVKRNSSDGYWEYFFESGIKSMEGEVSNQKRRGEWKIYYEDGKLREQGNFVNNKREGLWTEFYEDGSVKGKTDYTYDKGRYTEYYPSGEMKAEGPKSGSKAVGLWTYYNKDGTKQSEGLYNNGKRTGNWTFYHPNTVVSARGTYESGKTEGEWIYYHENGEVSSKGSFIEGSKSGYWNLFYDDGTRKGEANFVRGNGEYKEYYKSGNLRLKGMVQSGKNQGVWKYFYETGQLEGEANFVDGRGTYYGYYPDGTLQTKGIIENNKRVGRWELYKNDGTLSGYYKPIYDDQIEVKTEVVAKPKSQKQYGVGAYRFKGRKFKYFDSKINEFQGFILGFNPAFTFLGQLPLAMEFYIQERLGHEFAFTALRDPFYTNDQDIPLNDIYTRGYHIEIRQKFYNEIGRAGHMWYFGHGLRFANQSHYSNIVNMSVPDNVIRASASEQRVEYMILGGYRLMQKIGEKGFTIDIFAGVGGGYRDFQSDIGFEESFEDLPQGNLSLAITFGLNFGYLFSFDSRN